MIASQPPANTLPANQSWSKRFSGYQLVFYQCIALASAAAATRYSSLLPLHTMDLGIYYRAAVGIVHGLIPYRDFPLEYPPLACAVFLAPLALTNANHTNFSSYLIAFPTVIICLIAATSIVLFRAAKCSNQSPTFKPFFGTSVGIWFTVLVILASPLLPWRYDAFPALLTLLALAAFLRGASFATGIWIGLGIAAKLYPIVLLVVFLTVCISRRDLATACRMILGTAVVIIAMILVFYSAGAGVFSFLRYHSLRGLEMESVPAGVLMLLDVFCHVPSGLIFNFGAFHLVSPFALPILQLLPYIFALTILGIAVAGYCQFRKQYLSDGQIASESIVAFVVASLLAFMVTNKVFSAQYVIWLLPFAALLNNRRCLQVSIIVALTMAYFPFGFSDLLNFRPWTVIVLNMRNAGAIILLCDLVFKTTGTHSACKLHLIMPTIWLRRLRGVNN